MSTSASSNLQVVPTLNYVIGAVVCTAGARAIVNPKSFGPIFGLPVSTQWDHYIPALGGRNLTIGATLIALTYQGHFKASGTLLYATIFAGIADTWANFKHNSNGPALRHAVATGLLSALGWANWEF